MANEAKIPPIIYAYVGGAALFGFVVYKGMQKLGLIESAESKKDKQNAAAFDKMTSRWITDEYLKTVAVAYKKKYNKTPTIKDLTPTPDTTISKARVRLYDAKGFFNDDEEKLYGVFRDLRNGVDIYRLNAGFKKQYEGRNILDFINSFTGDDDRAKLYILLRDLKDFQKS